MGIYSVNFISDLLEENSYPGRGIIIGKSSDKRKAAVAYFIMGRSENSRNRIFVENGDEVIIRPFDESKVEDPSLIIYSPIKKYQNRLIVTNGNHTDTIVEYLEKGQTFERALETRCFEPDAPNFTPRISGMLTFEDGDFMYKMGILKSGNADGSVCNRHTFRYIPIPGLGHFIHTYNSDGDPIPSFTGEPERVVIPDDINVFTDSIWNSLNSANKISLYVRYIDLLSGKVENRLINKNI